MPFIKEGPNTSNPIPITSHPLPPTRRDLQKPRREARSASSAFARTPPWDDSFVPKHSGISKRVRRKSSPWIRAGERGAPPYRVGKSFFPLDEDGEIIAHEVPVPPSSEEDGAPVRPVECKMRTVEGVKGDPEEYTMRWVEMRGEGGMKKGLEADMWSVYSGVAPDEVLNSKGKVQNARGIEKSAIFPTKVSSEGKGCDDNNSQKGGKAEKKPNEEDKNETLAKKRYEDSDSDVDSDTSTEDDCDCPYCCSGGLESEESKKVKDEECASCFVYYRRLGVACNDNVEREKGEADHEEKCTCCCAYHHNAQIQRTTCDCSSHDENEAKGQDCPPKFTLQSPKQSALASRHLRKNLTSLTKRGQSTFIYAPKSPRHLHKESQKLFHATKSDPKYMARRVDNFLEARPRMLARELTIKNYNRLITLFHTYNDTDDEGFPDVSEFGFIDIPKYIWRDLDQYCRMKTEGGLDEGADDADREEHEQAMRFLRREVRFHETLEDYCDEDPVICGCLDPTPPVSPATKLAMDEAKKCMKPQNDPQYDEYWRNAGASDQARRNKLLQKSRGLGRPFSSPDEHTDTDSTTWTELSLIHKSIYSPTRARHTRQPAPLLRRSLRTKPVRNQKPKKSARISAPIRARETKPITTGTFFPPGPGSSRGVISNAKVMGMGKGNVPLTPQRGGRRVQPRAPANPGPAAAALKKRRRGSAAGEASPSGTTTTAAPTVGPIARRLSPISPGYEGDSEREHLAKKVRKEKRKGLEPEADAVGSSGSAGAGPGEGSGSNESNSVNSAPNNEAHDDEDKEGYLTIRFSRTGLLAQVAKAFGITSCEVKF